MGMTGTGGHGKKGKKKQGKKKGGKGGKKKGGKKGGAVQNDWAAFQPEDEDDPYDGHDYGTEDHHH